MDINVNNIISEVIEQISANLADNEMFLSEADLQFSFAQTLDKILQNEPYNITNPKIILEYPILTEKLYEKSCENCKESFKNNLHDRESIDLFFQINENNKCFIEFKYKLKSLFNSKNEVYKISRCGSDNEFYINEQGGVPEGHYQIYEDIERMENISHIKNCKSFLIFITNESLYWGKDYNEHNNAYDFPLSEDCHYTKTIYENNKTNGLEYKGKISGEKPRNIFVECRHNINWKKDYKTIGGNDSQEIKNNNFCLLIIDCTVSKNKINNVRQKNN